MRRDFRVLIVIKSLDEDADGVILNSSTRIKGEVWKLPGRSPELYSTPHTWTRWIRVNDKHKSQHGI